MEWNKLHNKEPDDMYSSSNLFNTSTNRSISYQAIRSIIY